MPTLLCADADRGLCQMLARALGADGYRVSVAHDGDAALEALLAGSPDLALLDMTLPAAGGLAVLESMRRSASPAAAMPVILWSDGVCSADQVERARQLGASALLRKPVPLDALATRIAKLLARERPGAAGSGGARPQRAALRGSLDQVPFSALLHQAHGLRANGVLQLKSGDTRKEVELREGRPAAVRSNLEQERLGNWLMRTGRIAPDVIAESARRLLRGEGLQGQILVGMQVLSEQELLEALRAQAEEKLLEIFGWAEGAFALIFGATLKRATAMPVVRSSADLIRIGVRSRMPLGRIDGLLRSHAQHVAARSANPFYSFQEIELGREERGLLEAGQRGFSMNSLLGKAEPVRRAAYTLLETGLLELRDGAGFRRGAHAPVVGLHGAAAASRDPAPAQTVTVAAAVTAARPLAPPTEPAAVLLTPSGPGAGEPPAEEGAEDHSHYAADHEHRAALTELLERLGHPSPFEKLGVTRDASEAEIRSAYMRLARETHPDRFAASSHAVNSLAEQAFREVTRAFELLSDPVRLAIYREDPERDRKEAEAQQEAERALAAEQAFQKGEARLRTHDWSGALGFFEEAVELFPDEGEYVAYCGWAYYLTHGHEDEVLRKAFALVKRGAKLAPDREKPYLFLGRLCQAAGRLESAERMFTKAIECRPDSIEALRELRLLQMRRPKRGLLGRLLRRPSGS